MINDPRPRNPRAEANALLPPGYEGRVLEPSPPANLDPSWFADDPTDPGGGNETVVTPIEGEGVSWDQMVEEHSELAGYASDHWLGAIRRLQPLPDGYDTTRRALHQIAFFAFAPKRYAANAKMGLRYSHAGFGTPFFGHDEQVRIERGLLVRQQDDRVSSTEITTLADACEFLDIPYEESWFADFHDPLAPVGAEAKLEVDGEAAKALGDWFGFSTLALENARRTEGADGVTRVQLWPEHFDPAFEMGSAELGHRASYGSSPGDDGHPEPYLYVAAWGDIDRSDPYWNDETFNGASLSYQELAESENPLQTALDFLTTGYEKLTSR
jgi:hypothetical protein